MNDEFRSLLSQVNQFHECSTDLLSNTIRSRIEEAYEDDNIDGSQYDYLVGLLEY